MTDNYPHESPLVMGIAFVILGILGLYWRLTHPWIPYCPYTTTMGAMLCDDMDYLTILSILSCVAGVLGLSMVIVSLQGVSVKCMLQ